MICMAIGFLLADSVLIRKLNSSPCLDRESKIVSQAGTMSLDPSSQQNHGADVQKLLWETSTQCTSQGTWVRDDAGTYLKQLTKSSGRQHYRDLADSKAVEASKWVWKPTDETCEIKLMTRETLCAAMHAQGLGRLFMVGDSMSFNMFQSLFYLVAAGEDAPNRWTPQVPFSRVVVKCPHPQSFPIELVYVRNDELSTQPWHAPWKLDGERWGTHRYAPWVPQYLQSLQPTLLVLNTGLHSHTIGGYKIFIDNLVRWVNSSAVRSRTRDTLLFRLSVPGHPDCAAAEKPLGSPSMYIKNPEAEFAYWYNIEAYNAYTEMALRDTEVRLLDVFPMTLLRPDGHISPNDCLHYANPGPCDWWNHLLLTQLLLTQQMDANRNATRSKDEQQLRGRRAAGMLLYTEVEFGAIVSALYKDLGSWPSGLGPN